MNGEDRVAFEVGDGTFCKIVFSRDQVQARHFGSAALEVELRHVRHIRRMPELDQYREAERVPVHALLASGWWLECPTCLKRFGGKEAHLLAAYPQRAWCTVDCCRKEIGDEELQALMEASLRTDLVNYIGRRWPGVTIGEMRVALGEPGEAVARLRPPSQSGSNDWLLFDYIAKTLVIPIELAKTWGHFESDIGLAGRALAADVRVASRGARS